MKRIALFTLWVMGIASLFGGSCAAEARAVQIQGEQYRSGFYPDYMWIDDVETDEQGIRVGFGKFYRVIADDFSMYQSDSFSDKVGGELYCLQSQWEDASLLYHDGNIYRYQAGFGYFPEAGEKVELDVDFGKFDVLAAGANFDSLHWQEIFVGKSDTLALSSDEIRNGTEYFLQASSRDGRLVSLVLKLFIYEDKLYYFVGVDGRHDEEDVYYYSPVDAAVNGYFQEALTAMPEFSG